MKKILIANRGLSAIKFIVSIREYYSSEQVFLVGVCSPNDILSDYRYLSLVDEVIYTDNNIYMDIEKIVSICVSQHVDAVFPGWGYLSENSDFVNALEKKKT